MSRSRGRGGASERTDPKPIAFRPSKPPKPFAIVPGPRKPPAKEIVTTMPKTVILGTARTPFGKMGGALAPLDATELGGHAIEQALERAGVAPEQVQHVIVGQVLQAGQGQIPSRQAQIKAGIPKEVSSETVNKVCASGFRAAGIIDQQVRAGDLDVAVRAGWSRCRARPTC